MSLRRAAVAKARADAAEGTVPDKAALAVDPEFYRHAQQPLPITRSDDGFIEKHNIEFVTTSKGIDLQELNDLFEKVWLVTVAFPRLPCCPLHIACTSLDTCSFAVLFFIRLSHLVRLN